MALRFKVPTNGIHILKAPMTNIPEPSAAFTIVDYQCGDIGFSTITNADYGISGTYDLGPDPSVINVKPALGNFLKANPNTFVSIMISNSVDDGNFTLQLVNMSGTSLVSFNQYKTLLRYKHEIITPGTEVWSAELIKEGEYLYDSSEDDGSYSILYVGLAAAFGYAEVV